MGWYVAFIIANVAAGVIIYLAISLSNARSNNNRNVAASAPRPRTVQAAPVNIRPDSTTNMRRFETGSMVYFANDRFGTADKEYRFNYKQIGGSWRAYILRIPNIRGRSGSIPHILHDENGNYICWSGVVNNLKDMQNISRAWADRAQNYMVTGNW